MDDTETGTVLIVDDDAAIRDALALLMGTAGLESCCFASGPELLARAPPTEPSCLLLDLRMPGMDGLEVQGELRARAWDVPIVFLTAHGEVPLAVRAMRNGAVGFLEKPSFDRRELLDHVRRAIEQHRETLGRRAQEALIRGRIAELSPRELEVARLAAGGHANKVIAIDLGISERTVEVHRGRAMRKLELRRAADLIRLVDLLDEACGSFDDH